MTQFKFSAGPWNIHEGRDAFGPEVREPIALEDKIKIFKQIGLDAVQFHDDDVVPEMNNLFDAQIRQRAREVRTMLDDNGLAAEFVAPRLWEDPRTIDGAFTSNNLEHRDFAVWRAARYELANKPGDAIIAWLLERAAAKKPAAG